MKTIIKNVLHMIHVVISVLKKEMTLISSVPALLAGVNKLISLASEIDTTAQDQLTNTSGLTEDKNNLKGLLANHLAKISCATMAYAYEIGNLKLEKEVCYSESALEKISDDVLLEIGTIIYNKSFALKTELADYGLVDGDFTKLTSMMDSFKTFSPAVSEAKDKHKMDTALLDIQISATRKLFRKKIDRLMRVIADKNPKFYSLYKNARAIDDYHGKSKKQMIEEGIGLITGTISSAFDGSLLEDVMVEIVGTDFKDITDEDGYYYLEDVPAGTYTLKVTFDTYKELKIENVVLNPGDELEVDGVMETEVNVI